MSKAEFHSVMEKVWVEYKTDENLNFGNMFIKYQPKFLNSTLSFFVHKMEIKITYIS